MIALPNSKLIRNAFSLAATEVGGRIIRFLYVLVVARLLGPVETGIYLYGIALYLGVIGINSFGQHIFLSQRVGKHKRAPTAILHHSLTLTLVATLAVAVALALFVWASEPESYVRLTVLCFAGALVARTAAMWVRLAYVAIERPAWIPKYEVIFRGSEAIAGVIALVLGGGLLAIAILHVLFWTIEAGFSLRKLAREQPGALRLGRRWGYLKKVAAVSVIFLVSVTAMALFPQIGIILLRKLQPDGAFVGHFGIAMQFMAALMIAPLAATQAFLPRLSRSYSRGAGGHDLVTAVKLVASLAVIAAIAAAAFGPWFITLALGPTYAEAADLFRWLCWVFTPYAVVVLLGQCFSVIAARGKAVMVMVSMTVLHAGLLVAYVDHSPAAAAIGSMVVAAIAGMIFTLYQISRILDLQGHAWWLKIIFVVAASYAVFEGAWAPLMMTAPAALATGAILCWLFRVFNAEDLAAIRRLMGNTGARATP